MRKKKHLLLVVRWPVGGIRTFIRYVYSHFDRQHYRMTLILPATDEFDAIRKNLEDVDARFRILPERPGHLEFVREIVRVLATENIDLVHSHGFTSAIYAALPARLFGIPHILTSHDVINQDQVEGLTGNIRKALLRMAFFLVDTVHCVSYDGRKNLSVFFPEFSNSSSKLHVIPNGIEVGRFITDGKTDWRKKLNLPVDTFIVGFFGRFMAQKGFRYLVQAMEILREDPSIKPVVLAFGWGGFIREEQRELQKKGLDDLFYFLPFQENIAEAARGVDVVAMPSLWEAYGLLAAEMLVAGVPLIGTRCVGLREVLENTPAHVVSPACGDELARAIENEIKHPSRQKAELFRQTAAERYGSTRQIQAVKRLVEQTIEG